MFKEPGFQTDPYFDVRVTDMDVPSHPVAAVLKEEKKCKYLSAVETFHASFPFSCFC